MPDQPSPRVLRFGDFELDAAAYELRRRGRRVRLERLAMDLLILLVDRRDQLVTRSEIVDRLWGRDVFVEVDASVNTLIRKIRRALSDAADSPRFIQTVQGKGYRFIAVADIESPLTEVAPASAAPASRAEGVFIDQGRRRLGRVALGLAVISLAAVTGWLVRPRLVGTDLAPLRVAIMPIENLTGDPERDYLADGLTEEAGASLGQTLDAQLVTVLSRMSTRQYKGSRKSAADIGRELSVDYLLVGALLAQADRFRINWHLVRVSDQAQLWPRSYDPDSPSDRFAAQQELATRIAGLIGSPLSAERLAALNQRQTSNQEAFTLYLKGRYLGNQLTPATTIRALEAFVGATKVDPNYALPWSGIADALTQGTISGDLEPMKVQDRVNGATARAIKTGSLLPKRRRPSAFSSSSWDGTGRAASPRFREALRIDPRHAMAHRVLGAVLSHSGRDDEARVELARARELEPAYAMNFALSAMVEFHARDFAAAAAYAQRGLALEPNFWVTRYHIAQAYEQLGRHEEALTSSPSALASRTTTAKPCP